MSASEYMLKKRIYPNYVYNAIKDAVRDERGDDIDTILSDINIRRIMGEDVMFDLPYKQLFKECEKYNSLVRLSGILSGMYFEREGDVMRVTYKGMTRVWKYTHIDRDVFVWSEQI